MTDSESEDPQLYGRLESGRMLLDALQCIYSAADKAQDVEVSNGMTSREGICFSVCNPGSLLASVVIPARSFSEFRAAPTRVRVNLSLLVDCLSLPSTDRPVATRLSCTVDSLNLTMVEPDSITESSLRTVEGDTAQFDALRAAVAQQTVVASAILDSDALKDAISEMDYGGADTACISISTKQPRFVLSAPGGRRPACEVRFPDPLHPAQETFHEFSCEKSVAATYKLGLLNRVIKALALSDSAKIQMNEHGSLSIICRMKASSPVGASDRCYVEFLIIAQELEDDDSDEDGDEDARDAAEGEGEDGEGW